jgi:polysaccharide biosynthesis transport protein
MAAPHPMGSSTLPPSLRAPEEFVDHIDPRIGDESEGMGLAEYWHVVLRYKLSILGIVVIAGIIGTMSAMSAPPVYRAEGRLLAQLSVSNMSGGMSQFDPIPIHWLYFETQRDILGSRAVAEKVVDRLGLAEPSPKKSSKPGLDTPPEHPLKTQLKALRDTLPNWRDWIPPEWRTPPPPPLMPKERRDSQIDRIQNGVVIGGGEQSEVLVVGFESSDPEEAARIANAVADAYIEFGLQSRSRNVRQTSGWLTDRIDEMRKQLGDSEQDLRSFQAQEGMVDTQSQGSLTAARLGSLTSEQIRLSSIRSQAEERYNQIRKALSSGAPTESLVALFSSNVLFEMSGNRSDAQRLVSELSERYGERHPKMIAARADLTQVTRLIENQIRKGFDAVRKDFEVARAADNKVRNLIDTQQEQMRARSGKAFTLSQLEREVESNRKIFESFIARSRETDVQDSNNISRVRVIDRAQVPRTPFKPNRRRMVMTAVFAGFAIGILLALIRNHLDSTFKTREDVERKLGLPVVAVMPKRKGRLAKRAALVAAEEPQGAFAESINDVRTAVMLSQVDDPPKVILLTSTVAGEGKTTLASNLAIAFSQRGRTLLLEADLRRGHLPEVLMVDDGLGLTDFVTGNCSLQDALLQLPDIPNLFLMQGGTPPPNAIEIISSHKFTLGLHNLRKAFDYIIIDCAPVMPVSDSIVLGHQSDVVLMVVQSERTSHSAVKDALKRLQAARIRPAGVVLQQADLRRLGGYGQYYGGYSSYYTQNRT